MGVVAIKELLEAGVHFGHQTNRWNPKMKGFYSVNAAASISSIFTNPRADGADLYVRDWQRRVRLFVGTNDCGNLKPSQARQHVFHQSALAADVDQFQTIRKSIDKMKKMETTLLNPSEHGLKERNPSHAEGYRETPKVSVRH